MPSVAGPTSREPVSPTMACPGSLISRTACPAVPMGRSRPGAVRRGLTTPTRPASRARACDSGVDLAGVAGRTQARPKSPTVAAATGSLYIETVND
jgi:hypothetical protein